MMQTAKSLRYGVYLNVRRWPCSERFTGQPGHDHLRRICRQICPDGLGR